MKKKTLSKRNWDENPRREIPEHQLKGDYNRRSPATKDGDRHVPPPIVPELPDRRVPRKRPLTEQAKRKVFDYELKGDYNHRNNIRRKEKSPHDLDPMNKGLKKDSNASEWAYLSNTDDKNSLRQNLSKLRGTHEHVPSDLPDGYSDHLEYVTDLPRKKFKDVLSHISSNHPDVNTDRLIREYASNNAEKLMGLKELDPSYHTSTSEGLSNLSNLSPEHAKEVNFDSSNLHDVINFRLNGQVPKDPVDKKLLGAHMGQIHGAEMEDEEDNSHFPDPSGLPLATEGDSVSNASSDTLKSIQIIRKRFGNLRKRLTRRMDRKITKSSLIKSLLKEQASGNELVKSSLVYKANTAKTESDLQEIVKECKKQKIKI